MATAPKIELDAEAVPRLVELLLEEQHTLSAVEQFARHHEREPEPRARFYREALPARPPEPGEQYAFEVDLDQCTGCKACVTACHSLNGLQPEETWRDVGLLVGQGASAQQTVTAACHHCEDPACLAGCPVKAYDKDPVTGIVRHLDDQCIGCQYCVLKCPYDVPKYNPRLGIVRKCDMCAGRLEVGEAPACVEGCPNEAISIRLVKTGGEVAPLLPAEAGSLPDSAVTRPTTRYRTRRELPPLVPADLESLHPADAHHPLAAMLVLTQLAVGLLGFGALALGASPRLGALWIAVATACGLTGLAAAQLHLGRPQYAFRAFLGLRTSWLSREILVLGAFSGVAVAATLAAAVGPLRPWLPALEPFAGFAERLAPWAAGAAVATGALGVFCSIMIYVDTRRRGWSLRQTAPRFLGTAVVLGTAAAAATAATAAAVAGVAGAAAWLPLLGLLLPVATTAKLIDEARLLPLAAGVPLDPHVRTARLQSGPLAAFTRWRFALGALGGVAIPLALLVAAPAVAPGWGTAGAAVAALAACLAGEGLERFLYFASSAPRAMPGRG
ncbi:MAG: 4Fe-4S dicluster domain-containing protein [Proteobacteria bacterium]|nr:4Fe-4S dicluster domain-containing protein [Pseudomonadota bacterium]